MRRARLEVISGPHKGQSLTLAKPVVGLGRGTENALALSQDPKVSRFHVEIKWTDQGWIAENISQKNSLEIDGHQVKSQPLPALSIIAIGDSKLRFHQDLPAASAARSNSTLDESKGHEALAGQERTLALALASGAASPQIATANHSNNANSYQMGGAASFPTPERAPQTGGNGRIKFYGGIAIAAVIVYFVFNSDSPDKKKVDIRGSDEVLQDLAQSESAIREIQTKIEKKGEDTPQYQAAEQHYLKGFRDYQQGQYGRAMQSFQAALSFYPQHELAKKYLVLARRKFDELVRFHLIQGRKYRAKNNFRLCSSSYSQVLIMVKDAQDPSYKEAKQFYDECELRKMGR